MKNLLLAMLSVLLLVTSCKKDDPAPKPTVDFTYTGGGCTAPCAVLFENKSTNADSYFWEFGDGTTATEENPTKNYAVGGTYSVILTATGEGGTASATKQVLVQQSTQSQLPVANFTFTGGGCNVPCSVSFTNTSTNATSYSWDFGDGANSTEQNTSHTYTAGGTYSVILTATNAGGSNQITKIVNVAAGNLPVTNFSFIGGNCIAPCTVSFANTSTNATSYSWDFGDGSSSTQSSPPHTYDAGGAYSVILTATNAAGSNQVTKIVNIGAAPTTVKITKVTVVDMPFTDGSGASWDVLAGPDVFFTVTDQLNNVFSTSSTFTDVSPSDLPLTWTFGTPFLISDLSISRYIDLWDADSPDADDYMSYVGFLMSNYTSGGNAYPSSVTNTQNSITVKLDLIWE